MNILKKVRAGRLFLLKYLIFKTFFLKKQWSPSPSPKKSSFEFRLETLHRESFQQE